MLQYEKLRFEPTVIVDYLSPQGAQVTDIRGVVLQGSLAQLRDQGHFHDYLTHLPSPYRDQMVNVLASSWVSAELYAVHLQAVDALGLSDVQHSRMSEAMGAGLFHNLFASLIRAARANGGDRSIWVSLRQADRMFSRMHQGGAFKATQVGPKDAVLEFGGLTFGHFRSYRIGTCAFLRGALSHATKACVCKPQHPPREDRLALLVSWV